MNFFIVSDDQSTGFILSKIIKDYNLGSIFEYSYSKFILDNHLLDLKNIDILIVNSSIPFHNRLSPEFNGKVIVVSQINDKKTIAQAYSLGVEYYITKPINQFEVIGVIKKVVELIKLQKCMYNIRKISSLVETKT